MAGEAVEMESEETEWSGSNDALDEELMVASGRGDVDQAGKGFGEKGEKG